MARDENHQGQRRGQFERMLEENAYQQQTLARKIAAHEKAIEQALRRDQAVDFLLSESKTIKKDMHPLFVPAATKAFKTKPKNLAAESVVYEIEREVLAFKQQLIPSKLSGLPKP